MTGMTGRPNDDRAQIRDLLQQRFDARAPAGMRRYTFERGASAVAGKQHSRPWREITRETPARRASRESDVQVPLQQAAVSGAMTTILCTTVTIAIAAWQSWRWWVVPAVSFPAGMFVMAMKWEQLLSDSRGLLRRIETYIGQDLDGDGQVGSQKKEPETIRFEVQHHHENRGGQRLTFADVPVAAALFTTWAGAAVNGQSLAVSRWTGGSGLFSRSEYDSLIGFMEQVGMVEWVNEKEPKHGRQLTRAGKHAIRAWLDGRA